jgi:acetyl-CoA carboxylase biotin carboxyl carrier protein
MKIDASAIRQLAKLLDETGLNEIEVANGDEKIRVNKGGVPMMAAQAAPATVMVSDPTIPQPATTQQSITAASAGAVTSPMVGTVYLQAEPGNPPFVQAGSVVKAGDTLVIIEAMKVMNPIKAPKAGTVRQVLVNNGQPVEFGEVLVVVD